MIRRLLLTFLFLLMPVLAHSATVIEFYTSGITTSASGATDFETTQTAFVDSDGKSLKLWSLNERQLIVQITGVTLPGGITSKADVNGSTFESLVTFYVSSKSSIDPDADWDGISGSTVTENFTLSGNTNTPTYWTPPAGIYTRLYFNSGITEFLQASISVSDSLEFEDTSPEVSCSTSVSVDCDTDCSDEVSSGVSGQGAMYGEAGTTIYPLPMLQKSGNTLYMIDDSGNTVVWIHDQKIMFLDKNLESGASNEIIKSTGAGGWIWTNDESGGGVGGGAVGPDDVATGVSGQVGFYNESTGTTIYPLPMLVKSGATLYFLDDSGNTVYSINNQLVKMYPGSSLSAVSIYSEVFNLNWGGIPGTKTSGYVLTYDSGGSPYWASDDTGAAAADAVGPDDVRSGTSGQIAFYNESTGTTLYALNMLVKSGATLYALDDSGNTLYWVHDQKWMVLDKNLASGASNEILKSTGAGGYIWTNDESGGASGATAAIQSQINRNAAAIEYLKSQGISGTTLDFNTGTKLPILGLIDNSGVSDLFYLTDSSGTPFQGHAASARESLAMWKSIGCDFGTAARSGDTCVRVSPFTGLISGGSVVVLTGNAGVTVEFFNGGKGVPSRDGTDGVIEIGGSGASVYHAAGTAGVTHVYAGDIIVGEATDLSTAGASNFAAQFFLKEM